VGPRDTGPDGTSLAFCEMGHGTGHVLSTAGPEGLMPMEESIVSFLYSVIRGKFPKYSEQSGSGFLETRGKVNTSFVRIKSSERNSFLFRSFREY